MERLKEDIYKLYDNNVKYTLSKYNGLIKSCVEQKEMAAVVFLYDNMKHNGVQPNEYTFKLIDKLHSKKIPENNNIPIKNQNVGKLKPRRRIHKIMKGHNYSENYNAALQHLEIVKKYITSNPDVKYLPRIRLAKKLSKECKISFNDARYIITNLKRTKFLNVEPKQVEDFSKTEKILHNLEKKQKRPNQTKLSSFFKISR